MYNVDKERPRWIERFLSLIVASWCHVQDLGVEGFGEEKVP